MLLSVLFREDVTEVDDAFGKCRSGRLVHAHQCLCTFHFLQKIDRELPLSMFQRIPTFQTLNRSHDVLVLYSGHGLAQLGVVREEHARVTRREMARQLFCIALP